MNVLTAFKNEQMLESMMAHKEALMQDNRQRLQKVRNLDDLVSFKVSTMPPAQPHPAINSANTTDPTIQALQKMLNEEQNLQLQASPKTWSLADVTQEPVTYLKKMFGNQKFKEFKVSHANPLINKYSANSHRSKSSHQLQQQDYNHHPTHSYQSVTRLDEPQPDTSLKKQKYRQKLEQLRLKTDQPQHTSFDPNILNLSDQQMKYLKRTPAHLRLKNQLSHLQQYQPQNTDDLKPHYKSSSSTVTVQEVSKDKKSRSQVSQLLNLLHEDLNYVKYPADFSKLAEMSRGQNQAIINIQKLKSSRQTYLASKSIFHTSNVVPLKQHQQKNLLGSRVVNANVSESYQPHLSESFKRTARNQQSDGSDSSFQKGLQTQSQVVLSPINISKMQVAYKTKAQMKNEQLTLVTTTAQVQNHYSAEAEPDDVPVINSVLRQDETSKEEAKPEDVIEQFATEEDYIMTNVEMPQSKVSDKLLNSEQESVSTLNEQQNKSVEVAIVVGDTADKSIESDNIVEVLTQTQQMFKRKTRYHSPTPFQVKNVVQPQQNLQTLVTQKPQAFLPGRFKKFPRFSVSNPRSNYKHLPPNAAVISLNDGFLHLLANANHLGCTLEKDESTSFQHKSELSHGTVTQTVGPSSSHHEDDLVYIDNMYSQQLNSIKIKTTDNPSRSHDYTMQTEPQGQQTQLQMNVRDPFDEVLLEKYIDNALLTSSRTMTGLNNTISLSMKIIHNKFTPSMQHTSSFNGQLQGNDIVKMKRGYQDHQLYEVIKEEQGLWLHKTSERQTVMTLEDAAAVKTQIFNEYPSSIEVVQSNQHFLNQQSPSNITLEDVQQQPMMAHTQQFEFEQDRGCLTNDIKSNSTVMNLENNSNYSDTKHRQKSRHQSYRIVPPQKPVSKLISSKPAAILFTTRLRSNFSHSPDLLHLDNRQSQGVVTGSPRKTISHSELQMIGTEIPIAKKQSVIHQIELVQPILPNFKDAVFHKTTTLLSGGANTSTLNTRMAKETQRLEGFTERTTVIRNDQPQLLVNDSSIPVIHAAAATHNHADNDSRESGSSPMQPQLVSQMTQASQQTNFADPDQSPLPLLKRTPADIIKDMRALALMKPTTSQQETITVEQPPFECKVQQHLKVLVPNKQDSGLRVMIPTARLTADLSQLPSPGLTELLPRSRVQSHQAGKIKRVAGFNVDNKKTVAVFNNQKKDSVFTLGLGLIHSSTMVPAPTTSDPTQATFSQDLIGVNAAYQHDTQLVYPGRSLSVNDHLHSTSSKCSPSPTAKTAQQNDDDIQMLLTTHCENIKIHNQQNEMQDEPLLQEQVMKRVPTEDEKITKRLLEMDGMLGSNGRHLKAMIDKLYSKEKQFVYTRSNLRDESICPQSIIFDLRKAHPLNIAPTDSHAVGISAPETQCLVLGTKMPMSRTSVGFKKLETKGESKSEVK